MKITIRLLTFILALGLVTSALADQQIIAYSATTAQSPIKRGCEQIIFACLSFTGTIGNATFSSAFTGVIPVSAVGDGQALGAVPYTVTSGANSLTIIEVR